MRNNLTDNFSLNELKVKLTEILPLVTTKNKKGKWICPFCRSGSKKNGTSAFEIYNNGLKGYYCHSCGKGGDIFSLVREKFNITEFTKIIKKIHEILGIEISDNMPSATNPGNDYTTYFKKCAKQLHQTNYHRQRGISDDVATGFMLGYDENWKSPTAIKKNSSIRPSPRLIIPTSNGSYVARNIRSGTGNYAKMKEGHVVTFNGKALYESTQPVFIVEGEMDALSIITTGNDAVALGSATRVDTFLHELEQKLPTQPLIIALDNDEAGEKAARKLATGLQKLNIPFVKEHNLYGKYKDANEALVKDRDFFFESINRAKSTHIETNREIYQKKSAAAYLMNFISNMETNTPFIPTGFGKLDDVLDGGLYEGLYVIGAISSLGKTTLITQIADQIAQANNDVLIFSLEMARYEIMAKSISRHTLQIAIRDGIGTKIAKTLRDITTKKRYENYSINEMEIIQKAIKIYAEYATNIYINEGVGDTGINQIQETIKQHISFTGRKPVMIIDYIQILAPYNERMTDKQNIDKTVLELKRISRDYRIPIIGISSFNRANYKSTVTMEAFKESGAVEYSSDVLIGLQLKGVGNNDFEINKEKSKNPREVELVILKNRNGATGNKIPYFYYPQFNFFEEH
jgi:replicative DNA helicase